VVFVGSERVYRRNDTQDKGVFHPTLLRALAAAALWGLAALPLRADAFDHFLLA
jgi:hypothetical protein